MKRLKSSCSSRGFGKRWRTACANWQIHPSSPMSSMLWSSKSQASQSVQFPRFPQSSVKITLSIQTTNCASSSFFIAKTSLKSGYQCCSSVVRLMKAPVKRQPSTKSSVLRIQPGPACLTAPNMAKCASLLARRSLWRTSRSQLLMARKTRLQTSYPRSSMVPSSTHKTMRWVVWRSENEVSRRSVELNCRVSSARTTTLPCKICLRRAFSCKRMQTSRHCTSVGT